MQLFYESYPVALVRPHKKPGKDLSIRGSRTLICQTFRAEIKKPAGNKTARHKLYRAVNYP
ncbi:hypothetical protein GCM10027299_14550 [Larkinella ripae]